MLTPSPTPAPVAPGRSAPTPALIAMLIGVTGLSSFSLNVFIPAIPSIASALDSDVAYVQLAVSLYMIGLGCAQLILGPLSDRIGRRPVMLGGLAVAAGASLFAVFAASVDQLLVARVAQAVGGAAGIVIGRAIIRDMVDRERTAALLGLVTSVMIVSPMFAPLIGGIIDTVWDWRGIFAVVAVFAAALLTWAVILLPETLPAKSPGSGGSFIADVRVLSRSVPFWCFALAGPTVSGAYFTYLGGGPHTVITLLGRSSAEFGLWGILPSAGFMTGNFLSARLSTRYGVQRMIRWGVGVTILGTAMMVAGFLVVPAHPLALLTVMYASLFVLNIGNGLEVANAIAGAVSVRPQAAGTAAGVAGFLHMTAGAVVAQFASYIMSLASGPMPLAILALSYSLIAVIPVAILARVSRREQQLP